MNLPAGERPSQGPHECSSGRLASERPNAGHLSREQPTPSEAHRGNLFSGPPAPKTGERFEDLLRCRDLRIERILSSGQPDPSLYDQPQDEWVALLQGQACLEVEGEIIELRAGDYLFIPAHRRHRVLQTSSAPPCLWLAIHLDR